jgi:hypothetical protein
MCIGGGVFDGIFDTAGYSAGFLVKTNVKKFDI